MLFFLDHNFHIMPCTCLVINCKSRGKRDNVGFFAVPTVLNHKFATHKNELTKLRREKWIAAIKRPDILNLIKYQRVCGRHFISGILVVLIKIELKVMMSLKI